MAPVCSAKQRYDREFSVRLKASDRRGSAAALFDNQLLYLLGMDAKAPRCGNAFRAIPRPVRIGRLGVSSAPALHQAEKAERPPFGHYAMGRLILVSPALRWPPNTLTVLSGHNLGIADRLWRIGVGLGEAGQGEHLRDIQAFH